MYITHITHSPATVPAVNILHPFPPVSGCTTACSCLAFIRHSRDGGRGVFECFSPIDSVTQCLICSLKETLLEGRNISCFNVGGEDRLCLTQLLQLVLHSLPLSRIHQVGTSTATLGTESRQTVGPRDLGSCGRILKLDLSTILKKKKYDSILTI